jgi:hypothetical protein
MTGGAGRSPWSHSVAVVATASAAFNPRGMLEGPALNMICTISSRRPRNSPSCCVTSVSYNYRSYKRTGGFKMNSKRNGVENRNRLSITKACGIVKHIDPKVQPVWLVLIRLGLRGCDSGTIRKRTLRRVLPKLMCFYDKCWEALPTGVLIYRRRNRYRPSGFGPLRFCQVYFGSLSPRSPVGGNLSDEVELLLAFPAKQT